jgi:internalin A
MRRSICSMVSAIALAGLGGCWQSETLVLPDDPCAVAEMDTGAECGDGALQFADAHLEAALRETIGKPTGSLTAADVAGLTTLDASDEEIADLDGIQCLTSLTELNLFDNAIADLGPLAGLPALADLNLHYNQISDLSPLAGLPSLTVLRLSDNDVSDLDPLACLTELSGLLLDRNAISDLAPLAELTSLSVLDVGYNEISDLAPFVGQAQPSELYLNNNEISDLGPLAGIASLSYLDLGYNEIIDLAPLVANEGLGDGDVVSIIGDPWDPWTQDENICALCNRGVDLVQGSGSSYCDFAGSDEPWSWCL